MQHLRAYAVAAAAEISMRVPRVPEWELRRKKINQIPEQQILPARQVE